MHLRLQHIAAITLTAFFLLLPGRSQAAGTIGVIITEDMVYYEDIHARFLDKIGGFINEQAIEIIEQTPTSSLMSYINAARKLKTIGSKVIITYGMTATLTTMKEVTDTPIIFAGVYGADEIKIGGKNATGVSNNVSVETMVNHLKSISDFSSLGVLFSKFEKDSILQAREVKNLGESLGFKTVLVNAGQDTIDEKALQDCGALLITTSCAAMCHANEVITVAREKKIPTAAMIRGGEEMGIICTISAPVEEQADYLADMVIRAYNGTEPNSMPIRKSTKMDLIINRKEAKALGLSIPDALLRQATQVIN
jgi:putative ABC transport system substrate-binding protein